MELEPGARVHDMSVVVNGQEAQAEILDVEKANAVFQQIVKEGGSPALLEYYGNQLIQTKVPRIDPQGTVTVKLRYTTLLEKKDDLFRLQVLNTNPKSDMKALKSASVRVAIRSQLPIKNIYSPSHNIRIGEQEDWDVVVTWSEENYLPKEPFVLYYQTAENPVDASLLAYREAGEEGHFMMMVSPTMGRGAGAIQEADILPKDVVFCVDTSGSMIQAQKLEQAREALRYCIKHLRPGDRFDIVDFGTGVRTLSRQGLVPFTPETRRAALKHIKNLAARGGTAIDDALAVAVSQIGQSDRLKMILFATDGLPTIGERSPQAILDNMAQRNQDDIRLFVFGEGYDVNAKLLDLLALNHRGDAEYITPQEDIKDVISRYFDRVGSPIMTDVRVEIEGLSTQDVLPRRIADMYRGEQVILYGRYVGAGRKTVRVSGNFRGETKTFTYELDFPEVSESERNAFVPRLWAGQMVDFLMNEIRASGKEDPELVQEVTYLAKRYGIVTPYTSFLMVEETCNEPLSTQTKNFAAQLRGDGKLLGKADGYLGVWNAKQQARSRRATNGASTAMYQQATEALKQEGRDATAMAAIRYVGNRCFYNSGKVWYDSRYDVTQETKVQNVEVGSREYLELLTAQPNLAKYMAQGDVVVEVRGQWYRFDNQKRG